MFLLVLQLLRLPPTSCSFCLLFCDQSSNSEFMNKSDEFVIASKDNVAFAQSVLFQGEFYIWRRLLKECGVGLFEELVRNILG